MGAAYGDGSLVILHHLPQKLGPGQRRDLQPACGCHLRIVGFDGAGVYHKVDLRRDVFFSLAVIYCGAKLFQPGSQRGRHSV